jgi:hypothetical protein
LQRLAKGIECSEGLSHPQDVVQKARVLAQVAATGTSIQYRTYMWAFGTDPAATNHIEQLEGTPDGKIPMTGWSNVQIEFVSYRLFASCCVMAQKVTQLRSAILCYFCFSGLSAIQTPTKLACRPPKLMDFSSMCNIVTKNTFVQVFSSHL